MKRKLVMLGWVLWMVCKGFAAFASLQATDAEDCAFVSHVIRMTANGDRIEGTLYIPHGLQGEETSPHPMLILSHGFSRDYGRHVANAIAYACAGIVTYTPNLVPIDAWALDDERQVANVVDHVKWLRQRASDPTDAFYGVGDPRRIALGGHSAGGAVSVAAVEKLQKEGIPISALVLLDAVPEQRTLEAAARLEPLPAISLRSRPGPCNAFGSVKSLEETVPFPVYSELLERATHCDPESPTDVLCRLLCGGSSEEARLAYREKVLEFLKGVFSPSQH